MADAINLEQLANASRDVDDLGRVVNGPAGTTVTTREGRVIRTIADVIESQELQETIAQNAADLAVAAAAIAEAVSGPTYASQAAGLAATQSGETFAVGNGDGIVTIYLNNAGAAVFQRQLATTASLGANESGKGLDLVGRPTVAQMLASNAPARGVGSKWYADEFSYTEAAAGANDQHLITAGGVKLYVDPSQRGYDARAFGAKDDWNGITGTNNFAIFEKMASLRPITIVLKKSRGGTGVYMLNGNTTQVDLTGLVNDPDPGVSFWVAGGNPYTFIKGQRSTRDLRTDYSNLRYQQTLVPDMRKRITELGRPGSALDGQLLVPTRLNFADADHWQLSSWPNGQFAAANPTSVAADLISWGQPPASSFVGSTFHVIPGDLIQAKLSDLTTYLPAILVLTDDGGWTLVRHQVQTGNLLTLSQNVGAGNTVETSTANDIVAQTTYRMGKATVGIHIFDQRSFALVLNGAVIRRYTTAGNIVRAGWAGGFGSAGSGFNISNPVALRGKKLHALKPQKWLSLADSTGDETVTRQSQFDYARQYFGGIGGGQVATLTNLAHSGDTSAAQLAALQAFNGGVLGGQGYDYCLIQIGINDIQTGVAVATYLNNVLAMINYCRAAGVEPIVGVPAMFYSQADAQAFGQDGGQTSRSDLGGPYRLALMQMLADNNVYCNLMTYEGMGAVVASLLSMKTSPWGDQIVSDNIHPTSWASMCLGLGWSLSVAAHLTHARRDNYTTGVLATSLPKNLFTGGVGATATPQYTVDDNIVSLGWYLSTNGVALADGTIVGTLPKRLRPRFDIFAPLVNCAANTNPLSVAPGIWKISADGLIRVYGVSVAPNAPTFIGISTTWKI